MKKRIMAVVVACVMLGLTGCEDTKEVNINFPFDASDVVNVEMYQYVVPADAEKKVVTEQADIETLYNKFEDLTLTTKQVEEVTGGEITGFRFNLSNNTSYELVYSTQGVSKGILTSPTGNFHYFTSADIGWSYEYLNEDYVAVPVKESELPTLQNIPVKLTETGFSFAEDVTEVEVFHTHGSGSSAWVIEGEELEELKIWLAGLECQKTEFEEGNSPGDGEGSELYSFSCVQFSAVSYPSFSYTNCGDGGSFLHYQGAWYTVLNPSTPPVEIPDESNPIVEVTENFVTEVGKGTLKQAVALSAEDKAAVADILDSDSWEQGVSADCMHDCIISIDGRLFHYHSECGTVTELNVAELSGYDSTQPGAIGSVLRLKEEDKETLNGILGKYITLNNVAVFGE